MTRMMEIAMKSKWGRSGADALILESVDGKGSLSIAVNSLRSTFSVNWILDISVPMYLYHFCIQGNICKVVRT